MILLKPLVRSRWLLALSASAIIMGAIARCTYLRGIDPARQWQTIGETLTARRLDQAERFLTQWVKQFPDDGNAWLWLGGLLQEQNRPEEALAALRKVKESAAPWPVRADLDRRH